MSITSYQGYPSAGRTFHLPQAGEITCLSPATNTTGESLAALAGCGQGADTLGAMLNGELTDPMGFWVVCCDCVFAFLPSSTVRLERRV
ncbi:hypothetical protein CLU85_2891 [Acidovorax sp. 69]|nr:hypothetical protein CLU85_2891 [Acidovorax sp. 69]